MLNQNLQVNLAFTADTTQAQRNLQKLYQSLNSIASYDPGIGSKISADMQSAIQSAQTLKSHLSGALNVKTGNLDLSRLNLSLKQSGQDLGVLSANLLKAGMAGEQAFMNIQRSIATANVRLKKSNGLLATFSQTMMNTAKWQVASTILHGFASSISSAFGYAKDLDKALTDIRIVTEYNAEYMADFADKANKAAQALNTTTTEYAKASLIYFQQGLSAEEVEERTNVTIKMANATGQSAQIVSDQMTAVWNNFDDGSKSLEYYADVMTKLGAATASSTDEIAQGLEKFSSVAETVGLSYEYATAALATVTATTRQSADVVGTAFKTLFARLNDLKLGETLEDGTTLGTYTENLAKIGVNIKDASGGLKDMDQILDETAEKWRTLDKDQQVALAKGVAGIRQYNQFIALMSNWDFMQENLETVKNSEGTLTEQAEKFGDNWEAANNRLKASTEQLWNTLIPKDFIIKMTDSVGDIVKVVDSLIQGFGGLEMILLLIANIALTKLGPSLANGINLAATQVQGFVQKFSAGTNILERFKENVLHASTGSQKLATELQRVGGDTLMSAEQHSKYFADNLEKGASSTLAMSQNMNVQAMKKMSEEGLILTSAMEHYLTDTSQIYNIQGLIEQNAHKLTSAEKERLSTMQQQLLMQAEAKAQAQQELDIINLQLERLQMKGDSSLYNNAKYYEGTGEIEGALAFSENSAMSGAQSALITNIDAANLGTQDLMNSWLEFINTLTDAEVKLTNVDGKITLISSDQQGIGDTARESANAYGEIVSVNTKIASILKDEHKTVKEKKAAIKEVVNTAKKEGKISKETATNYEESMNRLRKSESLSKSLNITMGKTEQTARRMANACGNSNEYLDQMEKNTVDVVTASQNLSNKQNQYNSELATTVDYLTSAATKASTLGGMLATGFQGFSTIAMGISSVSNAIKTLGDESADFTSKLTSLAMAGTMGFGMIMTVIKGVTSIMGILQAKTIDTVAVSGALTVAKKLEAGAIGEASAKQSENTIIKGLANAQTKKEIATILNEIGVKNAEGVAQDFLNLKQEKGLTIALKTTLSNIGLAASEYAVLWPILLIIAALAVLAIGFAVFNAAAKEAEKAFNADANAAKEAAASAKALEEEYNKLKESAKELKEEISNYEEAIKGLENLKEGTEEYNKALEEANEQAKALIEKYGLWNDYTFKDGKLIIDDKALDNLEKNKNKELSRAENQMYTAKIFAAEAQMRSEGTNTGRKIGSFDTDRYETIQTEHGSYQKEIYHTLSSEESLYIAKVLNELEESQGGVAASTDDLINKLKETGDAGQLTKDSLNNLSKFITSDSIGTFRNLGNSIETTMSEIEHYTRQLIEGSVEEVYGDDIEDKAKDKTGEVNQEKANALKSAYTSKIQEEEKKKEDSLNKKIADAESETKDIVNTKQVKKFLHDADDQAVKNVLGEDFDIDKNGVENDKQLALTYAAMISGQDKSTFTYKGGSGIGTVKDAEGNEIVSGVSDEVMRREIAKRVAAEEIRLQYASTLEEDKANSESEIYKFDQAIDTLLNNSMKAEEKYEVDFTSAILDSVANQDFENLDFSSIYNDLSIEDIEKLQGLEGNDILKELGLDEETIKALGFEVDDFTGAFSEAIDGWTYSMETSEIEKTASELNKVTKNIKSYGDTITEEDFTKLKESGVEVDKYFTKTLDGTYKLTAAADDFQESVKKISIDKMKTEINNLKKVMQAGYDDLNAPSHITKNMLFDSNYLYEKDLTDTRLKYATSNFKAEDLNLTDEELAIFNEYLNTGKIKSSGENTKLAASIMEKIEAKTGELEGQIFTSASTLDELQQYAADLDTYSFSAYADGLISLAGQYENTNNAIENFQYALRSGDEALINSAKQTLETAILAGEAAEKYGLDIEEITTQSQLLSKEYDIDAEAATRLSIQNQRLNNGVKTLSENWDDWKKTIKSGNKTSLDYAKTVKQLTSVVKELTGASADLEIPQEFFEIPGVMENIEKAAQGDIKAINLLGVALGKNQVENLSEDTAFFNELKKAESRNEGKDVLQVSHFKDFETNKQAVLNGIAELEQKIANGSIKVGDAAFEMGGNWVESLNQMALQTNMSVDEMNSLLDELGVDAHVTTEYVDQETSVPVYETITSEPQPLGDGRTRQTSQTNIIRYEKMQGKVPVAQISMGDNPKKPNVKYIGNGNVSPSSTPSGSGGGSKNSSKKSDVVKRYKEIDDKLDQNTKQREKLEAMTDTLTGQARLDNINAIIEKRKEENKLLEEKYQWAKKYAEEDKKDLDKAASEAGVKFEYNEDGTIKNYTAVMTSLYDKYNADGNIDENEQEKLDNITNAMDTYEETLQTQEDLEKQHLDNQLANQQDHLDGINAFYDKKQSLLDSDNEYLEYYIAKYEKDFSKHVDDISNLYSEQGANIATSLGNLEEKQNKLRESYENGDINLQQFQEASKQSQSDIIAQLQAYDDLTESMNNLYGSAMEDAREEIDLYTAQQEHLNSVLDHYSSILDIVGKEQDYAAKRNILTSKANNINNELKTQTALYEQYSADAIHWEEEMNKAKQEGRELDYERYKTYWQNAQESANEAQDNMLAKTEEWAEAMRAVVENELADLGKTLEKSLTGEFGNFENLTTSMERANSLQEEYLTTTNKIYETNKMMRTAQQEIDKTTNTAAKNRLKQFINETEQLQNQTKLSQYELDIQQAKYDLLLAEIALEEAQNAKSTVRLQRDAEGNMGYVYTADSSKVAEAEQQLADAQNALYNIGLEGANDYNQKYAETMSEMYDTLKELQIQYLDGAFATEQEYQDAMAAAKEYYYEKLEQYSSLYTVAIGTDARVISDAWSTQFNDMMYKTEDWKAAVEEYSTDVATHLQTWADTVKTTLENSGLTDTEKAVKGINDESKNLAKTLLGEGENEKGLVGALEKTSKQVQDQQTEFENLAVDIETATKEYEEYLKLVRQDINANEDHTKINGIDQGSDNNSDNNTSDNNSNETTQPSLTIGSSVQVKPGTLWYGNSYGGGSSGTARDGVIKYISTNGTHQYNIGGAGWIRKEDIVGYDTGGYTGDWGGSYGKLAMLHKKELVLEPGDTQNFLMSMEILDRIVSAIDLYSMNAQLGGLLNTPYYSGSNSPETLEQNVHIEASFPGVSDRNELEEAFNNLINQASQYANRK